MQSLGSKLHTRACVFLDCVMSLNAVDQHRLSAVVAASFLISQSFHDVVYHVSFVYSLYVP